MSAQSLQADARLPLRLIWLIKLSLGFWSTNALMMKPNGFSEVTEETLIELSASH